MMASEKNQPPWYRGQLSISTIRLSMSIANFHGLSSTGGCSKRPRTRSPRLSKNSSSPPFSVRTSTSTSWSVSAGSSASSNADVDDIDASGRTIRQQLDEIAEKVRALVAEQYRCIMEEVLPRLEKARDVHPPHRRTR